MKNSNGKIANFFKKNALYITLAFCILAVGLSVMFIVLSEDKSTINNFDSVIVQPDNNGSTNVDNPSVEQPNDEPVVKVITFAMPVENTTGVSEYTESLVFNQTLGRYSSHKAMDFYAPEGTKVLAVYGGKIISVENSPLLSGVSITIDHGNGLYTIYNSLSDGDDVFVGQTVEQGDIIGEVSLTNRQEYKDGAHLHFEVKENGEFINPEKYLTIVEK